MTYLYNSKGMPIDPSHRCTHCTALTPMPQFQDKFCPYCGRQQHAHTAKEIKEAKVCPECGNNNHVRDAIYCFECGRQLYE